jgi:hypothetical protein
LAATNLACNHHVVWYENDGGTQLTLFDNGATDIVQSKSSWVGKPRTLPDQLRRAFKGLTKKGA